MTRFLKRLAVATSRTIEDAKLVSDPRVKRAMRLLYGIILGALLIIFLPISIQQFARWSHYSPSVRIAPSLWHLYVPSANTPPCEYSVPRGQGCPADPANPSLWSGARRELRNRNFSLGAQGYWVGAVLSPELLEQARIHRANQLLLGWIRSTYRVWIDGEMTMAGDGVREASPIVIPIAMSRLAQAAPLRVAIYVADDSEFLVPDILNSTHGGEGFAYIVYGWSRCVYGVGGGGEFYAILFRKFCCSLLVIF